MTRPPASGWALCPVCNRAISIQPSGLFTLHGPASRPCKGSVLRPSTADIRPVPDKVQGRPPGQFVYGKCLECNRKLPLFKGTVRSHGRIGLPCPGGGQAPTSRVLVSRKPRAPWKPGRPSWWRRILKALQSRDDDEGWFL